MNSAPPRNSKLPTGTGLSSKATSWLNQDWLAVLILVLAIIATYQPIWHAGYLWDDDLLITSNPCIIGPLGLKEIWTTSAADICPLTLTTYWLEHALWGLNPLPYHLVNVLLHAACAVLLWRVLLGLGIPGAWLGAALWALHPVEVESVAWLAEMKNTESGLFFLCSIFFFLRWLRAKDSPAPTTRTWSYGLTLLFAAMAMASKSSTVILPLVLGLCAWWMEGKWQWRNLVILIPALFLSMAASVLSIWTQSLQLVAVTDPQWVRTGPERIVAAGDAVWFYLGKLLWPHPLITIYPRWQIDAHRWIDYVPLLATAIVLFILWSKRATRARPFFFILAYFLVALIPVLGFVDNRIFRYSLVFDHFQYLASMGPMALAGAGIVRLTKFISPRPSWWRPSLCAVLLFILGTASWFRAQAYESQETLWTDTLTKNPDSWIAANNLALALSQKENVAEAVADYRKALALYPNYLDAHNNLGDLFLQAGQTDEAMAQFQSALKIDPKNITVISNLGNVLSQRGQMDAAADQYQKALQINPLYTEAHYNLGALLAKRGQLDDAIIQFKKTLEINPNFADASNYLANVLLQEGRDDEAMVQFKRTLEIDPSLAEAHNNLGTIHLKRGQMTVALAEFQRSLEIDPLYAEAHYNLGESLLQLGRVDEAITQFQKALEIKPTYAEAHNNLGYAYIKSAQMDKAMAQFQKALEINPDYVAAHNNLGSVFYLEKRFGDAAAQFQEVVRLNPTDANAKKNLANAQARTTQSSK